MSESRYFFMCVCRVTHSCVCVCVRGGFHYLRCFMQCLRCSPVCVTFVPYVTSSCVCVCVCVCVWRDSFMCVSRGTHSCVCVIRSCVRSCVCVIRVCVSFVCVCHGLHRLLRIPICVTCVTCVCDMCVWHVCAACVCGMCVRHVERDTCV